MQTSYSQSHLVFAMLMATLLAVPFLVLLSGPSASAEPNSTTPTLTDRLESSWKTGLVEGAYLFNEHLSNFDIDTEVTGNTVTLKGTVSNDASRALAEQVALSVEGIDLVENQLLVEKPQEQNGPPPAADAIPDATIATRVKSQLLVNRETSGLAIDVDTTNQVVTLTGDVENAVEKELAYYIARNTRGVRQVINKLTVDSNI